ncbi:MAG: single-stranded-DNA-specific exonuclease RecJ [Omnitrophica WOR_2 bacterium GWF2_38_59]|nr:MAG: single-stranded-DNA-specific exonuclease RecJ [Omnitrophica WOR_2 bacterium GWA2_37_7]OGX26791.1 MAG: single-stranded-DNA-specific exonuclease RecJ [Omnitrophica WOR_2 bacterium GWF2_38_59]OGX49455.1 MAG: single-stranded-DNA-specific exonuclease RecJ [Omnitrophica WOR_2 bacterium RIFOXYA2_FULL_38_17]OGX54776.1 MAG: single-stranded-DNA-specific exonuclease RecJ [Omnitrophica WOR_2 bacterium RIFOXYA12_FULL_38_10]OGX57805.1 MAG: single-stranded-DNA-specific exonuclease RecJ [Omnitrophica W
MSKNWIIRETSRAVQEKLSRELNVPAIISQILVNRGIEDTEKAEHFISAEMKDLHDPFLLKDMKKAVDRIMLAKEQNDKVLIYGDYDVDGVTSSAILHNILKKMGITVSNHIPHRMDDGYGLSHDIGEQALEDGVNLIITVDCGITAFDEVDELNKMGLEIIIIDHHEPSGGRRPDAYAVIDPKQEECAYPFRDLAAVGLVAKLAQALTGEISGEVLDLTAIGTVADVVPLVDENRIFVKRGLPQIANTTNKGLKALIEISKINGKKISPYHVGFVLGPRINAAGRMDSAHTSLNLFLSEDEKSALSYARDLDRHNLDRQKMQKDIVAEAFDIIESQEEFLSHKVIVLSKEGWHKGVLGIVASKISDKYYKPTIVISVEGGVGTASGRSIEGFHLYNALDNCSSCLEDFGGHEGAVGLTIMEDNIDSFRALINEVADKVLEIKKLTPTLFIDGEIELADLNLSLAEKIQTLEPFGEGNEVPLFCSRNLIVKSNPQILAKETLKFWVTDGSVAVSAVGFGMSKFKDIVQIGNRVDLAYQISIDDWNKAPTIQLILKDIKSA